MFTPWVLRLIIANVVVYVLTLLRPPFMQFLSFVPMLFLERPWTIVTYMFAHDLSGISHILFNMLSLFFFGPRLETELGGKHFLGLYFLSGIMGALLSFVFSPNAAIIGASGAAYGVMFGYAFFWPRDKIYIWGVLPVEVRIMVLIMTAMSLWGGFGPTSDGIAHFAHLGGFVGGFAYLKLLKHTAKLQQVQKQIIEPIARAGDIQRWKSIQRERLHEVNRDEYDRIMMKLNTAGVASLSDAEKSFLDRFSGNM
jgi:membrane associated rhomboid family serine protease